MEIPLNVKLPTKILELDSPELAGIGQEFHTNHPNDHESLKPDYSDVSAFASQAEFFNSQKFSVSWRLLNQNNAIVITPLELDASRLPQRGRALHIKLPFFAVKHCIGVSETPQNELVFDVLSTSGHVCSFIIPHVWLIMNETNTVSTASRQGLHSVDYALSSILSKRIAVSNVKNIISAASPKLVKAVSATICLVFLADGTFIKLERADPSTNLVFGSHLELRDPFKSNTTGALARIFNLGSHQVPNYPQLSYDAVVDANAFNSRYIVTYSVDNSIRLWDLVALRCLQKIEAPTQSKHGNEKAYRGDPGAYTSVKSNVMVVMHRFSLKFFELINTELVELTTVDMIADESIEQWFLAGGLLLDATKREVLVAFKLNAAAKFFLYRNGKWHNAGGFDRSDLYETSTNFSEAEIKQRVGKYSDNIVQTAFREWVASAGNSSSAKAVAASQAAVADINDISDFLKTQVEENADISVQWVRFDTICRNLEAQGTNVLSVAAAKTNSPGEFFWLLKSTGVSILSLNARNAAIYEPHNVALKLAQNLFADVPSSVFQKLLDSLLSTRLLTTRLSESCALLRNYLNQDVLSKVNESVTVEIAPAILAYAGLNDSTQSSSTEKNNSYNTPTDSKLSEFGKDAISTLIYALSSFQFRQFSMLAAICVIALVEGWPGISDGDRSINMDYSELLKLIVNNLRRFSLVVCLGASNCDMGVNSVNLEKFGIEMAKQILEETPDTVILARALPHISRDSDLEIFRCAASQLSPSPNVVLLLCFASLKAGHEAEGVRLAQTVSLAKPWIEAVFGERPITQAEWFYRVALFAWSTSAKNATATLINIAESLCASTDSSRNSILDLMFTVSVECGDVPSAYTAFTRRFEKISGEKNETATDKLRKLIDLAASKSLEDANRLVESYPFVGFTYIMDKVLERTREFSNSVAGYQLRYKFHITRDNYVGAAQAVYDHMNTEEIIDPSTKVELYELILSALSLVEPSYRWLLRSNDECRGYEEIKQEMDALVVKLSMDY